jgi:hypothetical protein
MNKTIYMTYNKKIPDIVFNRWKILNKNYNIDFSTDDECIYFLKKYFNSKVAKLFESIEEGMYKADLWRLCKLYIYGGVYADVDLVPYINIDTLDKDITFYSCLSAFENCIFQAFIISKSLPRNSLLLLFILSFIINKPYLSDNGPTQDMYDCLKYNLNNIEYETRYELYDFKIMINIEYSDTNIKKIDLLYFPNNIEYSIKLHSNKYPDQFEFKIHNAILYILRIDKHTGWEHHHKIDICLKGKKEIIYLFKENIGKNNNWITSYVTNKDIKILDSRDLDYHKNRGW